jgi:dATP pyrophosphohydrolase
VVIYDANFQVLLMQRRDDPEFWQSVTGSVEVGETPQQTALREVLEETGINILEMDLSLFDLEKQRTYAIRERWLHKYPPGTQINTEHQFLLKVPEHTAITLSEHNAMKWVPCVEAVELAWSSTNGDAIKDLMVIEGIQATGG